MAINFWNSKLLKLCLHSWLKYTRHKMKRKMLSLEHERKAKKMEMFMKAAELSRQQQQQQQQQQLQQLQQQRDSKHDIVDFEVII